MGGEYGRAMARVKQLIALFTLATLVLAACASEPATEPSTPLTENRACDAEVPTVDLGVGSVCGVVYSNQYDLRSHAYLGIPYAQQPVADLRWKAPEPLDSLEGNPFTATKFGSECVQPSSELSGYSGSEECLFLNIYRPTDQAKTGLPVMVWIPGGGFIVGSGSEPVMNGTALANQDVILVTMNYRLGALGFLRYQGNSAAIDGNFAILDQQLAMKWVKDNIERFGGDADKITLFGESAGSMSTGLHLFSVPDSNDLFRAAIMESNIMSVPYNTPEQSQEKGQSFVDLLCGAYSEDQSCPADGQWLRSLSTRQIAQAQNLTFPAGGIGGLLVPGMRAGTTWNATINTKPVTGQPIQGFNEGSRPKPYVFGVNHNEGVFFLPASSTMTPEQYEQAVVETFGVSLAGEIMAYSENGKRLYNPSGYEPLPVGGMTTASQALGQLQTDYGVAAANMKAASRALQQLEKAGVSSFGYHFLQHSEFNFAGMERCNPPSENICHTTEMPYVFSNFLEKTAAGEFAPTDEVTDADRSLADTMTQAWANFAKNPEQGLGHPKLTNANSDEYVHWDTPVTTGNLIPKVRYDFWEPILP
ncbi:para-nitrobenzyl esterase [Mycolicibacterium cyprinidarum]|uniref:Carboxylic ester hydrolase n=1 Tax=Mycolicibacterium cyprinidarum TaxID=2860311 RepID=A0ABQ4V7A1_9MYCO|nr:para-nitrobenzyl esterase [Mycolicibacterium sp. NGTWSNA01]GJF14442.1 para-nitrobenzyl esterase [Mycolicibacterium sp. NGTWS0302]